VTAFVDEATIRAARDRAANLPLPAVEAERWNRTVRYAVDRPVDPTAERAAGLRTLFGSDGSSDAAVLATAARLLSEELDGSADAVTAEVRRRCLQWFDEDVRSAAPLLELFTGHHKDPEAGPPVPDPALVHRLETWLAARVAPNTRIESASMLAGGFSRLMLDVRWTEGGHGVFRIEQDGMFATDGAREVAAMRAVRATGYPAPAVLWEEHDAGVIGAPFFVMEFVSGAARTDDAGIDDMLRSLADLHRLGRAAVDQVADLDGVPPGSPPESAIDAQLEHWHQVYRAAVPTPIPLLERAFAWLRMHLRPTGPTVIVHGDPGPGNALQNENGVAAVIDWEFAHAGDAAEDWAYLALIRGRKLAGPAEWKARIAATVGVEFDEATWLAWEVYNNVKGACVNLTALDVFRRSARPNPDLLAIGVAVHLRFLARAIELTAVRDAPR
jgi:aminoglycoside phosphotransferase (APT) family kinase protein